MSTYNFKLYKKLLVLNTLKVIISEILIIFKEAYYILDFAYDKQINMGKCPKCCVGNSSLSENHLF